MERRESEKFRSPPLPLPLLLIPPPPTTHTHTCQVEPVGVLKMVGEIKMQKNNACPSSFCKNNNKQTKKQNVEKQTNQLTKYDWYKMYRLHLKIRFIDNTARKTKLADDVHQEFCEL